MIRKLIFKLFALCILFVFMTSIFTPFKVEAITATEEEEMGKEFIRAVSKQLEFINDPVIVGYINKIGNKLLAFFPPQPFEYNFYIVKEDVYNAFAGPGGHIFINSGLFEDMECEEELAGILAHEISHVVCRHISEKIARASKIGMMTLAGMIAGIVLGVGGSGTAASAVTIGSMAAGQSFSLAYSRDNEMQADQVGLMYLAKAGYSGKGLLTMLNKIRDKQWFGTDLVPSYLMTHPAVEERLIYIDVWIGANPLASLLEEEHVNSFDFERAHTRLLMTYGEADVVFKKFRTEVEKHPSDPLANYRYGMILARTGNEKDAVTHIKTALGKKAFDPYILKDLGIIYFNAGRYKKALSTLIGVTSISENDFESLYYIGRTRMALGQYEEAVKIFDQLLEQGEYDDEILYFIGEAYDKQGYTGESHYYLGVYYKKKNDVQNALFHLKKAFEYLKDDKLQKKKKKELSEMIQVLSGKTKRNIRKE